MAASPSLTFPNRLLAKALIKRARSVSAAVAMADATMQFNHSAYIIKVLEANRYTRFAVKDAAALSNSEGQKQLVAILTMFEALGQRAQADFIVAFKGVATLAAQGSVVVVREQAWDPLHIPPVQIP